jgi:hypothetical protein
VIRNPPFGDPPLAAQQPRTSLLGRVPVEEITRQAREVHPGRVLLTVIGGLLFAAGWLAAKLAGAAWLALAWSGTAVQVGWRDARGTSPPPPDLAEVLADNQRLRLQIARLEGGPAPAGVA